MSRPTRPAGMEVQTGLPDACVRTNCPHRPRSHCHPVTGVAASEVVFLDVQRSSPQESDRASSNASDLARYNSTSSTALSHPAYTHLPPLRMSHPSDPMFVNPWNQILDANLQQYGRLNSDRRLSSYPERIDLSDRLPSISEVVGARRGRSPALPSFAETFNSSYYNYNYSRRQSPGAARRHAFCYGTVSAEELETLESTTPPTRSQDEGEQSYYDFICAGEPRACKGEKNIRKSVSHFFGRNKGCTKSITKDMWVLYCRKHYQRGRYNGQKAGMWGTVQHDQLVAQMEKFDRYFTCDNWEVKYSCGLKKAVDIFSVNADAYADGIDEKYRNTVMTAYAMRTEVGRGKSNEEVWDLIHLMKMLQGGLLVKENIALEFLPHGLQRRSDAPTSLYTTATASSGHPLQPNPHARTNRAALNGSGRHSTKQSSTRQTAIPRRASLYYPDVARPDIPELTLPPLGSSRMVPSRQ